jgi:hypothetical protein
MRLGEPTFTSSDDYPLESNGSNTGVPQEVVQASGNDTNTRGLYGEARLIRTTETVSDGLGVDSSQVVLKGAVATINALFPAGKPENRYVNELVTTLQGSGVSITVGGLRQAVSRSRNPSNPGLL